MDVTRLNASRVRKVPQIKSLVGARLGQPTIHILAVGLTYKGSALETNHHLDYPVQDIEYLRQLLSLYPCFQTETLFDTEATKENIIRAFQDGLANCRPGDLLVLYLAGHAANEHNGWEFKTFYTDAADEASAKLSHTAISDHVQKRPPGVLVLQIRDTCAAAPNEEELGRIAETRDLSVMILCACNIDQQACEMSRTELHSVFLWKVFNEFQKLDKADARMAVSTLFERMLEPINNPEDTTEVHQEPRIVPKESLVEFIPFFTKLIEQLHGPPSV